MGNLLFIDSDDINGLSDALRNALERRGVRFRNGGLDFPTTDDEIPGIDPFYGDMSNNVHIGGCGSMGGFGCGGVQTESYGGCGGYVEHRSSCGGGGCGGYSYPRC